MRLLPAVALILAATPALADDACAAAPDPDCLIAAWCPDALQRATLFLMIASLMTPV